MNTTNPLIARKAAVDAAIARYPALAIGLTESEMDGYYIRFDRLTDHQRKACRLAGQISGWHPSYVAEMCPMKRPPLFLEATDTEYRDKPWEEQCQLWQKEHDTSIEALAQDWAEQMKGSEVEWCLQPLARHKDGVLMSAHDDKEGEYPCSVGDW